MLKKKFQIENYFKSFWNIFLIKDGDLILNFIEDIVDYNNLLLEKVDIFYLNFFLQKL